VVAATHQHRRTRYCIRPILTSPWPSALISSFAWVHTLIFCPFEYDERRRHSIMTLALAIWEYAGFRAV
jgi:hypothetical protein